MSPGPRACTPRAASWSSPCDPDRPKWQAILKGHTAPVVGVAFFPDGKTVATASDDWSVKLWDVLTGQERITLIGHQPRRVARV
jgi:WD40 repeat protein